MLRRASSCVNQKNNLFDTFTVITWDDNAGRRPTLYSLVTLKSWETVYCLLPPSDPPWGKKCPVPATILLSWGDRYTEQVSGNDELHFSRWFGSDIRIFSEVSEDFSFVLTKADGSKRWAFCRRYLTQKEGSIWTAPVCYCVTSEMYSARKT